MNDRFREMNARIRELGEQSHLMGYMVHLYTVNAPDGYRQPLDVRKAAMEKFAELIVQECIDNLSWHGHDEAVQQLYWLRENKLGMK